MTVLIFNPNQEKIIIDLQKTIIKKLDMGKTILLRQYPLWIDVNELDSKLTDKNSLIELKKLTKEIKKITVEAPVIDSQIWCPVKVETASSVINTQLVLFRYYSPAQKNYSVLQNELKKILPEEIDFPLEVSIFKAGIARSHSSEISELWDSFWCKLT